MKKITQEEFNHLQFAPKGIKLNEAVQRAMLLNINEALVLSNQEWTLKTKPGQYFYLNQDKLNGMYFKARALANEQGWAIIRVA